MALPTYYTRPRVRHCLTALLLTLFTAVAPAATLFWDTASGDGATITGGAGFWTNGAGNWNTGAGDTTWNNGAPDDAIFGGTAGTVTLGGAVTVGNMTFNTAGYTIADGGNILTLSNSTITANADATISSVLAGSTGLIKTGVGTLILTGANNYTGTTTIASGSTLQVGDGGTTGSLGTGSVTNNGSLIINRSNGVGVSVLISGSGTLTKMGGGLMSTNSANSYTGATIIEGGILFSTAVGNGGANSSIGASSNAATNLVLNGGTLQYGGANTSTDRLFSVGTGGGTLYFSGAVNFTNTGSMGFNGQSGARTLTFIATNVTTSNLAVIIGDNGGATSFTKSGSGPLALTANNTYTGVTTISGGTLIVTTLANGGSSSNIGASSSANTNLVLNGGTLKYSPGAASAVSTDRLFSVGTSGGTIDASGGWNILFTNTGSMGFNGQSGARTLTLTGNNANDNTLAAIIGDNGGATSVTKAGGGIWVLGGSNTYTGVTTVSGTGVLKVSSLANGGSASNIGASSNAATNLIFNGGTLTYTGGAVSTDRLFSVGTSGITLNAFGTGGINFTNAGSMGFNGQSGARTLTLANSNGGASTIAAIIGDNGGATSITHTASGIWALTGANTYTGVTTINGGTLRVLSLANGGSASGIGAASNANTNLVLNGGILEYNSTTTANTDRLFSVGTSGGTFSMPVAGTLNFTNTGAMGFNGQMGARVLSFTFSNSTFGGIINVAGVIGDNGGATSIVKSNTFGTLRLTNNNNTYTGTTTINGGTVSIGTLGGSTGSIGSGNIIINSGTLLVARTGTFALSQIISGAGGVTSNGATALTLSGNNTYTGVTNLLGNGGVLSISDIANGGVASNIGMSTSAATNLSITNLATLRYIGTGNSTDRLFQIPNGTANPVATIEASGSGALVFTNTGSMGFGGGSGVRTLVLGGTNTQNNTMTPVIGDNGGATTLMKSGVGTWVLAGTNTYTGVTTINGGVLTVSSLANGGSNSNIGASSNAATNLVLNGGMLKYTGGAGSTDRLFSVGTGGGTLDSSGTLGLTFTNTGSIGFNGQSGARTLTLAGSSAFATNVVAAVIGDSGGATSLVKDGSGSWTLTGNNAYSGTTTINAGNLTMGSNGTTGSVGTGDIVNNGQFLVRRSNAVTLSQTISGAGNLIQSGSGTTTLSGNNTYTGTTLLAGLGTISISSLGDGGSASGIGAATNSADNIVFVSAFSTLKYTGAATSTDRLFSIGVGAEAIIDASGSGAINFTNTGSIVMVPGGGSPRSLTLAGLNAGDNTLAAALGDSSSATSLKKSGAGTWVLTGANTYTGATTIIGGILTVSDLADGGVASSIGASSNVDTNLVLNGGRLKYTGGAASTDRLFGVGTTGGTLDSSGTGAINFTNTGSMGFNGQSGARTLTLTGSSLGLNKIAAVIGDNSGTTSLTKTGSGKWVLTGENTYSGTTTISAGVLQIGDNSAGGTFGVGNIVNNAALVLFRSGTFTLSQTISGTGNLSNAAGTAVLTGLNTYTGFTGVSAGTVSVDTLANGGVASNIGASSSAATNLQITGGTLKYTGASVTTDRLFAIGVSATINASGTGALNFNNTGSMGFMTTAAHTLTLTGTNTDNNSIAAVISNNAGTTSLIKSGIGTWVLSGANTYTGNTTISGGTLQIGNGGTSGSFGSGAVVNNALLKFNRSAALAVSNVISGTGSLVQAGTATTTLSGANSYTGVTTVNAGALSLASITNGGTNSNIGASTNAATNLVIDGGSLVYTGGAASTDRLFSVGNGGASLFASGSGALNFTNTGNMGFNGQSGARTLILTGTNTGNNTLAAVIGDNGGATSVTKSGPALWVLTGASTYTGATTLGVGTLSVSSLANGGSASSIGASTNAATNLAFFGGTLRYIGGATSTDRLFSVGTSGGTLDASGSGAVNFTNTGSMGFNGSGIRTLTLAGTNTGDNTLAAVIGNNGGATSLAKSGVGKWV